jgi:hypothetical protein
MVKKRSNLLEKSGASITKIYINCHKMIRSYEIPNSLHRLRWLVAILGSKKVAAWWDCSFMDETGIKFLSNPFPRSAASAAFHGTAEAAQRVHDAALGRIGCYHLFRLPLSIEERLLAVHKLFPEIPTNEAAMNELANMADVSINAPEGPVQIGVERIILTENSLRELAAHYHSAFTKGIRCYPYFSTEA